MPRVNFRSELLGCWGCLGLIFFACVYASLCIVHRVMHSIEYEHACVLVLVVSGGVVIDSSFMVIGYTL